MDNSKEHRTKKKKEKKGVTKLRFIVSIIRTAKNAILIKFIANDKALQEKTWSCNMEE